MTLKVKANLHPSKVSQLDNEHCVTIVNGYDSNQSVNARFLLEYDPDNIWLSAESPDNMNKVVTFADMHYVFVLGNYRMDGARIIVTDMYLVDFPK